MSSRMRRRKSPEQRKPRTQLKDMVRCPLCNAFSYPRVIADPQNEEEKKVIICGSCNTDMMPFFEAYAEFAKKKQEEKLAEETKAAANAEIDEEEESV